MNNSNTRTVPITDSTTPLKLPQRPNTLKRYLEIVRYAQGRGKGLSTVAEHFGISPATVVNASRAFGLTYEEVKRSQSLPKIKIVEKELVSEGALDSRTRQIVALYNSPSIPTLEEIGRKVGLTRQRVHQILKECRERGVRIARRKPTQGHWIERCHICRGIRDLAARQSLMTTRSIALALDVPIWKVYWHLDRLRVMALVPKHFGHFRSERIIQAIKLYNRDTTISAWKLGRELGYKNLPALFRELRRRGFGYLLASRTGCVNSARRIASIESAKEKSSVTSNQRWVRKTA